jgi:hypothetical protein
MLSIMLSAVAPESGLAYKFKNRAKVTDGGMKLIRACKKFYSTCTIFTVLHNALNTLMPRPRNRFEMIAGIKHGSLLHQSVHLAPKKFYNITSFLKGDLGPML